MVTPCANSDKHLYLMGIPTLAECKALWWNKVWWEEKWIKAQSLLILKGISVGTTSHKCYLILLVFIYALIQQLPMSDKSFSINNTNSIRTTFHKTYLIPFLYKSCRRCSRRVIHGAIAFNSRDHNEVSCRVTQDDLCAECSMYNREFKQSSHGPKWTLLVQMSSLKVIQVGTWGPKQEYGNVRTGDRGTDTHAKGHDLADTHYWRLGVAERMRIQKSVSNW